MATVVRTEKRKRGIFGTIMWWLFLAYNALMFIAFIQGVMASSQVVSQSSDAASKAGATIGTAIGAGMLLTFWLFGALILGLIVALTRGKKVTTETTVP